MDRGKKRKKQLELEREQKTMKEEEKMDKLVRDEVKLSSSTIKRRERLIQEIVTYHILTEKPSRHSVTSML